MNEIDYESGLYTKINPGYKVLKMIKKMYGKNVAFEIACCRNLVKSMTKKYKIKNLKR